MRYGKCARCDGAGGGAVVGTGSTVAIGAQACIPESWTALLRTVRCGAVFLTEGLRPYGLGPCHEEPDGGSHVASLS